MSELITHELERGPELAAQDFGSSVENLLRCHILEELVDEPDAVGVRAGKCLDPRLDEDTKLTDRGVIQASVDQRLHPRLRAFGHRQSLGPQCIKNRPALAG